MAGARGVSLFAPRLAQPSARRQKGGPNRTWLGPLRDLAAEEVQETTARRRGVYRAQP
jgi:hypothetical protein